MTDHLPTIQSDPLAMIAQAMKDGREINVDINGAVDDDAPRTQR